MEFNELRTFSNNNSTHLQIETDQLRLRKLKQRLIDWIHNLERSFDAHGVAVEDLVFSIIIIYFILKLH